MNDLLTFLLLSSFVVMSPGVDTALITKRTVSEGQASGYRMALGITTGSLVHTFAAAFGLSAILMQSALAFEIVKYVGAIYLIYLGVSSFMTRKKQETEENLKDQIKPGQSAFKQGLLSNVLNPKVAMFFLTFLPQFVTPGSSSIQQLLMMGVIYTFLSISWFFVYVFFINYLRSWLLSAKVQRAMDRATGLVLIGFGVKLAFSKQN
ncbi:LysE family translocator [Priestia flexa]|uniref:LysE family translocator n=1 Tax=Priestia flexa TaxID=86664 RepID=A0A1N6ZDX1_9BACI|nr:MULTISPECIES: LysE family translocator [Bacillaceae]KZB90028.1 lysine transporter LysE [Bacillus sp. VT 712]MBN8252204.1 LysE family translocator [Priestia flexa]MBN8435149.1 LysE family translocator [Priestia flexa]MBY6087293.1 LysE family translocator [Priestia flexa]MCA0967349.1 LysE family translocator [Priestia flexa]